MYSNKTIVKYLWLIIFFVYPFIGDGDKLRLELYKSLKTETLSVRSNAKVAKFMKKPILFINSHGTSPYAVDIKDGIIIFYPHQKYRNILIKTFTDVIGYTLENTTKDTYQLLITTVNGDVIYSSPKVNKWTKKLNSSIFCPPSAINIDNDSDTEFLFGDDSGKLHIFNHNGEEILTVSNIKGMITGPPVYLRSIHTIFVGASDGRLYAISITGGIRWKFQATSEIYAGPLSADMDGDGQDEIIVTTMEGEIYLLETSGKFTRIFKAKYWIEANPALADLNNDGVPEIIVGSWDNHVYAITGKGRILWSYDTGADVRTTPVVADLNNDGKPEVVVAGNNGKLFIFSSTGKLLLEKIIGRVPLYQPSLIDVDGDGYLELVVGMYKKRLLIFKTYSKGPCYWPVYRGDQKNSGIYHSSTSTACPGIPLVSAQ